jgi:hypothetical protein
VIEHIGGTAILAFAFYGFGTAANKAWVRFDGWFAIRQIRRDADAPRWMKEALGITPRSPRRRRAGRVRGLRDIAALAKTDLADIIPLVTKEHR